MDLLKSHKRRSRLSNALYFVLNIGLAVTLLLIVRSGQSGWLAVGLVLISKWRTVAVKPRFWFANILANVVDVIVGLGVVALLFAAAESVVAQMIITALYAGWLLILKPRSSRSMVAAQAGVAVFVGIMALASVSHSWDSMFIVMFMWLIGYAATHHVLSDHDEPLVGIYSLASGFVFAELGWVGYHWMFAYAVPGAGGLKIPQLAIVAVLIGLAFERAYSSYSKHSKVRSQDVIQPIIFMVLVIVVLLLFFNKIALNGTL